MDVYLQTIHQSMAYRLVIFHQATDLQVFPSQGFGTEAIELGPRSNKAGPCLVLLRSVTVTPEDFLAWFQCSLVQRFVTRLYWADPKQFAASKEDLLAELTSQPAPKGQLRMHCHPRSLEQFFAERLPLEYILDPRDFSDVLSVVEVEGRFWWRLHPASSLYRQSNTSKAANADSASTAVNKLEEAATIVGLQLSSLQLAIDLGAAPGGWTMYLAARVARVMAVDGADMAPEALTPNVTHIRCMAEKAVPELLRHCGDQLADILVSDMNMHICKAVHPIKALLPVLRAGGIVIATMKFFGVGRDHSQWEETIRKELEPEISGVRFVWLLANTVNERTLIGWRTDHQSQESGQQEE